MTDDVAAVLGGRSRYACEAGDCVAWLDSLPPDSVDLVLGSPPYRLARTYGIDFRLADQAWVDWMVAVFRAASRVCTGLVCMVVEGQTKGYRYTAEPVLLMADLHRAGFNLRKPPAYKRVGIPGSGGPDWLRNDYEFCVCVTRPGRLPWSDPTACGKPPVYAPGGAMSYRLTDGSRRNAHGVSSTTTRRRTGSGKRETQRPAGKVTRTKQAPGREGEVEGYAPPAVANPGNVIKCMAGGNHMGHPLAHENEAPFPLRLAGFFVRSFCPPGRVVADCFLGSGTTGHAALDHGRRFLGCDVRQSQVDLALRRLSLVTPPFEGFA